MSDYFHRGDFKSYSVASVDAAKGEVRKALLAVTNKIPVFISHKHEDLSELMGLIGFLEKNYDVKAYIDSQDKTMPEKTSEETARKLKEKIQTCDRFILLATNKAVESKWCNWELGYADSCKYSETNMAILPIKDESEMYKGSEYMKLYPYIVYRDGTSSIIKEGYYLKYYKDGKPKLKPLGEWFSK